MIRFLALTEQDHVAATRLHAGRIGYSHVESIEQPADIGSLFCNGALRETVMPGIINHVREYWTNRVVPFISRRLVGSAFALGGLPGRTLYEVSLRFAKQSQAGIALALLLCSPLAAREYPAVNIPPSCRQANWGNPGAGSCGHAALTTLLNQQGHFAAATDWRSTHSGGTNIVKLAVQVSDAGVPVAVTYGQSSPEFLEWSIATLRGCYVSYPSAALNYQPPNTPHAVVLVDLDAAFATIIDSNDTTRFYRVPRDEFLSNWYAFGGRALALLHSPLPPAH